MSADAVCIDTWAFLALINGNDSRHAEAMAVSHRLNIERRPLVTTEWVLGEFMGLGVPGQRDCRSFYG